jgi:biotin carboxyl carrier protein
MLVSVKVNDRETDVIVNQTGDGEYSVTFEGNTFKVNSLQLTNGFFNMLINGESHNSFIYGNTLHLDGEQFSAVAEDPLKKELLKSSGISTNEGTIVASMPGNVVKILVKEGELVEVGQGVIVLEAMKMENELEAPKSGKVKKIFVAEKKPVEGGTILVEIE